MVNEFIVKNGLITPNFQIVNSGVTLTFPTTDGTNGQALTTDGSGGLSFTTVSGGGGGGTEERFRLNYASTGDLSTIDQTTSGISSTNIISPVGGTVEINFIGHAFPPNSIIVYGFVRGTVEYNINFVTGTTKKIDGEGTAANPLAFGAFTGPITLTLREAETGASRALGNDTHAWLLFQFGD